MTWILFGFVWAIGGVYFGSTVGHDFVHSRDDRDISNTQFVLLFIASGPLVWLIWIAMMIGWLR